MPIFHFQAHSLSIKCLAVSRRYLVSGSNDEHIRIYDLQKRKELGTLLSHQGSITALQFSHPASSSEDAAVSKGSKNLLTFHWVSLYNALMKIFFIVSTAYIVVLLQGSKRTNTIAYNEMLMHDTFKIQHLLIGSALMSVFFHHKFTFLELAWSFSVWLESVAILPQLYMLSKGGKTRSLTVH